MNAFTKTLSNLLVSFAAGVLTCGTMCSALAQDTNGKQPSTSLGSTESVASNNPAASAASSQTKPHDNTFIIGPEDILAVNVWKEHDVSRSVPVRSDGMISLPLVGEVLASGKTPQALEVEIAGKLKNYISEPEVTVIVEQIKSQKFNMLGMIARPGSYPLTGPMTVLDAIALGGGFRDFAKQKSIYVLRKNSDGTESRLPFNYKEVIHGKKLDQNVKLQPGDTVVVP